jgi:PhoPQ-activated pathogenicity-related protein
MKHFNQLILLTLVLLIYNADAYLKQRSLVFVCDATSSMSDDLAQLRIGAKKILETFANRTDHPIKNYVLSVFRDRSKLHQYNFDFFSKLICFFY